jgi:quercetin dioxygenase-like cupin family protein
MLDVILKRFEKPDEIMTFDKGKFEIVHIGGMTIGRASYEPGWRWSEHIGKARGEKMCMVEHVGIVVSGKSGLSMQDGTVKEMTAGDVFYVAPGHDSWVIGDEPYVSIHLMGAEQYGKKAAAALRLGCQPNIYGGLRRRLTPSRRVAARVIARLALMHRRQ